MSAWIGAGLSSEGIYNNGNITSASYHTGSGCGERSVSTSVFLYLCQTKDTDRFASVTVTLDATNLYLDFDITGTITAATTTLMWEAR